MIIIHFTIEVVKLSISSHGMTVPGKQKNKADIPELPEHLKDLYERAIKDVVDKL